MANEHCGCSSESGNDMCILPVAGQASSCNCASEARDEQAIPYSVPVSGGSEENHVEENS